MSEKIFTKLVLETRTAVNWKGCARAADGLHASVGNEGVYPYEGVICCHCGLTVWWDCDRVNGGY